MRAVWSGLLRFGLVNMPVKLYKATEKHALEFALLHKKDLSPIRYARVCKNEGEEIPYSEVVRGFEIDEGDYVVLSDEDFEKADLQKTSTLEVIHFVETAEVDDIYFEQPYYIEPEPGAEKPYMLLHKALEQSNRGGLVSFVFHNREHLGLIKPMGDLLVLNQMRFAEDIRSSSDLNIPADHEVTLSDQEIKLALDLIRMQSAPFHPETYHDTYKDELIAIIEEKAQGKVPAPRGKAPQPATEVRDLMALLKQSLDEESRQHHSKRAG